MLKKNLCLGLDPVKLPFLKRSCRLDRSLRLLPARSESPVFERTDVRPIIEDLCPVTSSVELPLSFFFGFDSKIES